MLISGHGLELQSNKMCVTNVVPLSHRFEHTYCRFQKAFLQKRSFTTYLLLSSFTSHVGLEFSLFWKRDFKIELHRIYDGSECFSKD